MEDDTRTREETDLRHRQAAVRIWRGIPVAEAIRQSGLEPKDLRDRLLAAWRIGARRDTADRRKDVERRV